MTRPPGGAEGAATFLIDGHAVAAGAIPPALHVVSTPIGNLQDVTLRALRTLAAADLVACEDTRVTGRLLTHYGIRARLLSYNDHNAAARRPQLLAALAEGRSVALASDAGTPLVSDPGFRLVREAVDAGHRVLTVPGPTAPVAALSVSGLPSDAFLFAGFLPAKPGERRDRLDELARVPATLCFFETGRRLLDSLADAAHALGPDRACAVAREMTKIHEETVRGRVEDVTRILRSREAIRGEIVLLFGPPAPPAPPDDETVDRLLREYLPGQPTGAAASEVARRLGLPRRQVYPRAVALRHAAAGGVAPDAERGSRGDGERSGPDEEGDGPPAGGEPE